MGSDLCISYISFWQRFRLYILTIFVGLWVLGKRLLRWAWDPNSFNTRSRDNPPTCLVDSSLGLHKYVKLKGVKFHYVESGERDHPLIVLLHGFPDCWLSWHYQIPILSTHFRVVALDLKGFGDSDKPTWIRNYRIENLVAELEQFISALGSSHCTIIGHDLGALLGWCLSYARPDLVDKFVAVSCPHPNIFWETLSSQSIFNSRWLSFAQLPYLPEMEALTNDLQILNDYHSHLQQKDQDNYLEAYKYSFSRRADWTGPINYYRNLPFVRIQDGVEPVKVSTLLLTGSNDKYIKLESLVRSTDYCDKFLVKIIEESGHFPHQENPDMFNKLVLKFLKVKTTPKITNTSHSKGIMDRMFGAVSSTVKYGNSVFDTVHKRTNGVVGSIPSLGLNLTQSTFHN